MNKMTNKINSLTSSLRLAAVDFEELYSGKKDITPLMAVEIFLEKQLNFRTEKQNIIRRKRANLPSEKTLEQFDFGFQRSVTKNR